MVVGAGFAGIHAVKEIRKQWKNHERKIKLNIVLIDQNSYHLRKVLMFRPAVTNEELRVPLETLFPFGVELVQAAVTSIDAEKKTVLYRHSDQSEMTRSFDMLVVAVGSIIRQLPQEYGGIALSSLENAQRIRQNWLANFEQAVTERNPIVRDRLTRIAVVGAGLSGMETAAELMYYARIDAARLGLDPLTIHVDLYNAHSRLFLDGPIKVATKLEATLQEIGVTVKHGLRVLKEKDGILSLSNGEEQCAGVCIWTLGLQPNPILKSMGLPTSTEGHVLVDYSYKVKDMPGVYSIGDCAKIVEPKTGHVDGMTCKEAIPQAARLAKILFAELEGSPLPVHESYMRSFSIGLGPDKGLTWVNKWGLDIIITGKLAWRIKKFTWDAGSLLKV